MGGGCRFDAALHRVYCQGPRGKEQSGGRFPVRLGKGEHAVGEDKPGVIGDGGRVVRERGMHGGPGLAEGPPGRRFGGSQRAHLNPGAKLGQDRIPSAEVTSAGTPAPSNSHSSRFRFLQTETSG